MRFIKADIWDEVYGEFIRSQSLGESNGYDIKFTSVAAKVDDIRRRVGLTDNVSGDDGISVKTATASEAAMTQDDPMIDIVAAAMALSSRPMADPMAILKHLEEVFPEHKVLIRDNRDYLYERMGGKKEGGKPLIIEKLELVDPTKDSKIFEGIADKLGR